MHMFTHNLLQGRKENLKCMIAPLLNGWPLVVIPARLDLSHSPSVSGRPQRCLPVLPSAERCDRPRLPNSHVQNLDKTALEPRALKSLESQPTCVFSPILRAPSGPHPRTLDKREDDVPVTHLTSSEQRRVLHHIQGVDHRILF